MFEYKIMETEPETDPCKSLNQLGEKGWELVAVVADGGKWFYYFKCPRPLS